MIECPSRRTGSRSSRAPRIWETSISMCTYAGVPSVSTMWSARAASCTCFVHSSRPEASARSSSSWVPVSLKGMRPAAICSSTAASRSTPSTFSPLSANESARGRPTRPRPTTATLSGIRPASPKDAPVLDVLTGERDHEARIEVEVAREQAARFLGDPVDPLEPPLLHPRWRLRDAAGVEVERRPDAAHHGHVQAVAHARHPLLLLGDADAHPQHVRAGVVDLAHERLLLVRVEVAE